MQYRQSILHPLVYQWCKVAGFRVSGSYDRWGDCKAQFIGCMGGEFHNETKNTT